MGEEKKWCDLLDDEFSESFTESSDYRRQSHIVVEEHHRFIGGMELIIDEPELVLLFNPTIKGKNEMNIIEHLLRKGIEAAESLDVRKIFSLIHKSNDNLKIIQTALQDIDFELGMEKVLYQRKPIPFSKYKSDLHFVYKSLGEIGEEDFIKIFEKIYQPDIFESDPRKCFLGLQRMADKTKRFYLGEWEVAYIENQAVGITMPQLHDEKSECGSNFLVGVIPEVRRKGIGKILQRRAIEKLIKQGVKSIFGSTHANNAPMIRIFESLGYEFTEYQYFYCYKPTTDSNTKE
ncbi:MAG: GNAT family N-acetyltransferase [bacterium]